MKKYIVFNYEYFREKGALGDIDESFDSIGDARCRRDSNKNKYQNEKFSIDTGNSYIVDRDTWEIIE